PRGRSHNANFRPLWYISYPRAGHSGGPWVVARKVHIIPSYCAFRVIAFERCPLALSWRPPTISFRRCRDAGPGGGRGKRHGELVANLVTAAQTGWVGIGRTPVANKAWLGAHEVSMRLTAFSDRLHKRDRVLTILL